MTEKMYPTPSGVIHYWINEFMPKRTTLVFLPGLTADHRLFDKQIEYFQNTCNVFVWDAPGHAASWPFHFDFSLMDKARWLHEILQLERADNVVIVGQLAEAMEANLPYSLPKHSLLICGEKDKAGSCIRYNREWHKQTGIRLEWIKDAGHNSNTDKPEMINSLIEEMIEESTLNQ